MLPNNDFDNPRDPIPQSTWQYVNNRHVALDYDRYFEGIGLFHFDTHVLDDCLPNPGSLLDLGCGSGRHVLHFARRGFQVTGLDLSPHMLSVTRDKLLRENLHADLLHQDFCDLSSLTPASFDTVLCMFSTLGLIRGRLHRTDVLRQVHRVLKPGGLLVLHVHNRWFNLFDPQGFLWLLQTHFIMPFQGYQVGDKILEHYRHVPRMYLHIFSLSEVRRMLTRAGFTLDRVVYLNRSRDGELACRIFRSLRANGFIVAARA